MRQSGHNYKPLAQLFLYCLCGGIGVASDYCVYYAALHFGIWYQAANIIGYATGTLVSFFLNRRITFGISDRTVRRLALFFGVAGVGYGASALMLWLLVDFMRIDPRIAKLFTLPMVVAIQFLMNRYITFSAMSAKLLREG